MQFTITVTGEDIGTVAEALAGIAKWQVGVTEVEVEVDNT